MIDYSKLARRAIDSARSRLKERLANFDQEADPEGFEDLLRLDCDKSLVAVNREEWRRYLAGISPPEAARRIYGDLRLGAARSYGATVYVQACDVLAVGGLPVPAPGDDSQ